MKKNIETINILKRNKLCNLFKSKSVKINNEAMEQIDAKFVEIAEKIALLLKYEMQIQGRKVAKKQDVIDALLKLDAKKESFEV
ncbi:hypothetical protein J4468_01055 [Candidatus Woesearchaeota archaeon]|nr:hypothetical protein [Candidatus Woesearchaeota archaeon]